MGIVRHILLALFLMGAVCAYGKEDNNGVPFKCEVLSGYEIEQVKSRCDATNLQPIEGVWYYPEEKMSVVIERCENPLGNKSLYYRIVLVEANDMSLLPGTVIGYCLQATNWEEYKMWIYSEQKLSLLENPRECMGTLKDNNILLVKRGGINVRVRVNFSRFLPSLFKGISIVPTKKDVDVSEGFRKIYPVQEESSDRIIYL